MTPDDPLRLIFVAFIAGGVIGFLLMAVVDFARDVSAWAKRRRRGQ